MLKGNVGGTKDGPWLHSRLSLLLLNGVGKGRVWDELCGPKRRVFSKLYVGENRDKGKGSLFS